MNNINNIRNCYGCGVCSVVCPQKIIDIKLNQDGFYEPKIINLDKCTQCGLCLDVCSYSHDDLALNNFDIKSYSGWSNNKDIRHDSSSGGVAFEIGKVGLSKGYKVCGVKYNADQGRAEHFIANDDKELLMTLGSKYIQSYTVEGFKEINRKCKYLVIGTPCQIDSFRRYIRRFKCEHNFILMDFFCHGVPSMLLWRKYSTAVEREIGKLNYVSWRDKATGWQDSWVMTLDGDKGKIKCRRTQGDLFFKMFLNDSCLGKACYEKCKFKYKCSSADIRIGDLWGNKYKENQEGVSAVITFTQQGHDFLSNSACTINELPFDVVAEGQMKSMPPQKGYKFVISLLKSPLSLKNIVRSYRVFLTLRRHLKKVLPRL